GQALPGQEDRADPQPHHPGVGLEAPGRALLRAGFGLLAWLLRPQKGLFEGCRYHVIPPPALPEPGLPPADGRCGPAGSGPRPSPTGRWATGSAAQPGAPGRRHTWGGRAGRYTPVPNPERCA